MARTFREQPSRWLRKPGMVTAERRAYFDALDQGVNVRRKPSRLANEYDDMPVNRTSYERRVARAN